MGRSVGARLSRENEKWKKGKEGRREGGREEEEGRAAARNKD